MQHAGCVMPFWSHEQATHKIKDFKPEASLASHRLKWNVGFSQFLLVHKWSDVDDYNVIYWMCIFALEILHIALSFITTLYVNIIFYLLHKTQSFNDFPKVTQLISSNAEIQF